MACDSYLLRWSAASAEKRQTDNQQGVVNQLGQAEEKAQEKELGDKQTETKLDRYEIYHLIDPEKWKTEGETLLIILSSRSSDEILMMYSDGQANEGFLQWRK